MLKYGSLFVLGACALFGSHPTYQQSLTMSAKVGPVVFEHAHKQRIELTERGEEGLEYQAQLLGGETSAAIPSPEGSLRVSLTHAGSETRFGGHLTSTGESDYQEGSPRFSMKGAQLGILPDLNSVQKGAIEAGLLDLSAAFTYPKLEEPEVIKPVNLKRIDFDNDGETTRTTHWVYTLEEASLDKSTWCSVFQNSGAQKVFQFVAPMLNEGDTQLSGSLVYEGTWEKEDPMQFDLVIKGHLMIEQTEMKIKMKLKSEQE